MRGGRARTQVKLAPSLEEMMQNMMKYVRLSCNFQRAHIAVIHHCRGAFLDGSSVNSKVSMSAFFFFFSFRQFLT